MDVEYGFFIWDDKKEAENILKHDIDFRTASRAFLDPSRKIARDSKHSGEDEVRKFCVGKVDNKIMTVRFINRDKKIRLIGAGYWRQGRAFYYDKETTRF